MLLMPESTIIMPGKPCGKAERVAGRAAAVQFIQNGLCVLRAD